MLTIREFMVIPLGPHQLVALRRIGLRILRSLAACRSETVIVSNVLKVHLKVKPGMGGDYWWVECGACGAGWQVPHYAKSVW